MMRVKVTPPILGVGDHLARDLGGHRAQHLIADEVEERGISAPPARQSTRS